MSNPHLILQHLDISLNEIMNISFKDMSNFEAKARQKRYELLNEFRARNDCDLILIWYCDVLYPIGYLYAVDMILLRYGIYMILFSYCIDMIFNTLIFKSSIKT